jgi:type I restriction enzyme S subunit
MSERSLLSAVAKRGPKASEALERPTSWSRQTLAEFFEFSNGVNAEKEAYGRGTRFINVLEIIQHSHLSAEHIPGRITLTAPRLAAYRVEPGDVVFNRTSETQEELALAAVYIGNEPVVFGGFVIRGRPKQPDNLDARYAGYALRSAQVREQIIQRGQGAIRANIGQADLRTVTIPCPQVEEQRAIAAALSDVDALIAALDRLIAKKRDLKQAAMQQLLTGETRLPGFATPWTTGTLRTFLTEGATYGIVTTGAFRQSGVPMVRSGDIKSGRIALDLPFVSAGKSAEYARTVLRADDVLIGLVGYPGESAKVPAALVGANISRAVGLLRLNGKLSPDYLVAYFNSPQGRRVVLAPSAGSAQIVVNLADLNKIRFPIPSLGEQTAIAAVLSDMDANINALKQRRDKTRLLKQGMMQELLTGRIRLV